MLVQKYKCLCIKDIVAVKRPLVNKYFLAPTSLTSEVLSVLDFVFKNCNSLTISKIEITTPAFVDAILYFDECDGALYGNQVYKRNGNIFLLSSSDLY